MSEIKTIILSIILGLLFIKSTYNAVASENFAISYDTLYEVSETGLTDVNQTISLRNLTSDYYPTEYSLILIGLDLSQVRATDSLGPLKTEVKKTGDQTQINVVFNEKVAGINKTTKWRLSYQTSSLAFKNGLVWEIYLPGQPKQEALDDYNLTLSVPESFGPILYLSPSPKHNFYWTKNEVSQGGVTASFGHHQIFDFKLIYHLINPKLIPVKMEIALPPDTAYQQVNYLALSPAPETVETDFDGNWLARYLVNPREKIDVLATGYVKLFWQPQVKETLNNEQKNKLLQPQLYWEVNDEVISNLVQRLQTPKSIYDYVVLNLNYDYQKVNQSTQRLGAIKTLSQKNRAICIEFADLFVTLARAAGIPARVNNGYAYTTNSKLRPLMETNDILHAWPEYYDSKLGNWIMIDPTWGKTTNGLDYFTKLDLNHFVFAKKGLSSYYPPSAGSYKDSSKIQKDVFISFSKVDKEIKPGKLEVYFFLPEKTSPFFPLKGSIELRNSGPGVVDLRQVEIKTTLEQLSLKSKLSLLPPFGKKEILINYPWPPARLFILKPETFNLVLSIDKNEYRQPIILEPLISLKTLFIIGGFCVLIFFIIAGKTGRLPFFKPKK